MEEPIVQEPDFIVIQGPGGMIYHNLIFGDLDVAKNYLRMRESHTKFQEFTPAVTVIGFKKIRLAWKDSYGRKYFFLRLNLHHSLHHLINSA